MIVSAELRWFWKGAAPAALEHWFTTWGALPQEEPPRDDLYFVDAIQVELGLKRRDLQGNVEVKGLVRRAKEPVSAGPFSGHVEIWAKWTSPRLRLDPMPSLVVRKVRRLRRFDAEGREVGEENLKEGCHLELTEVSIHGRDGAWHTLGLEAYGSLDRVELILALVLRRLAQAPEFEPGLERSYPKWLAEAGGFEPP